MRKFVIKIELNCNMFFFPSQLVKIYCCDAVTKEKVTE